MTRSLIRLQRVDGGYDPTQVMTARVDLNWSRYTSRAHVREFGDALLGRLSNASGITSVALSSDFPLNAAQPSSIPFQIRGRTTPPGQTPPRSDVTVVSAGYFRTIGVPTMRGRVFNDADRDTANVPAVIGQRLATTYWPGRDPIGEQISLDGGSRWATVIGVVGDVRQNNLSQDVTDEIYLPFAASPTSDMRVLVRTVGAAAPIAARIRSAVQELDDKQPVTSVQTLEQLRGVRLTEPRVTTALLVSFAVLALVITAGGLAGAVGYSVSQRTSEIGIRMALGAQPPGIMWMVMREGLGVVALGLVVGLGVAIAANRLIAGLLFSVAPTDVPTYIGVAVLFLGIAAFACFVPARRAMGVNPVQVLRR
jgi:predicted permease